MNEQRKFDPPLRSPYRGVWSEVCLILAALAVVAVWASYGLWQGF